MTNETSQLATSLKIIRNDGHRPWVRVGLVGRERNHVAVFSDTSILALDLTGGGMIDLQGSDDQVVARWARVRLALDETSPTAEDVAHAITLGRDVLKGLLGR